MQVMMVLWMFGRGPSTLEHAVEVCDNRSDDDGDGWVDCADTDCESTCDADGDGYASRAVGGDDCDDRDPTVHPGRTEVCNGRDDDCDNDIDEADADLDLTTLRVWHRDADGDGFGSMRRADRAHACALPAGFVADATDCDDALASVSPAALEVCDDGIDNDGDDPLDDSDSNIELSTSHNWRSGGGVDDIGRACADG